MRVKGQTKKVLVAQHLIEGQFPVLWYRQGRNHTVCYGADVKVTNDLQCAVDAFAWAVQHQASCDGRL